MRPSSPGAALVRLALTGFAMGSFVGLPKAFGMLAAHAPRATVAATGPATSPIGKAPILGPDHRDGALARGSDGLFYAQARINGTSMPCLVDSGASALVIDEGTARRIGAISGKLGFDGQLVTVGGSLPAARHRIDHLGLAGHDLRDVQAIIVRGGDTPCLLGQEILARLDAVEMHGNEIVLR